MAGSERPAGRTAARGDKGAEHTGSQGRETLAVILSAAADIASEEGLEQLSMRRLASAVGMSKSGLYAHFGSKEELQVATIEHVREIFEAKVVDDASDDRGNRLDALLERWLTFFERKVFPGGCFVITSAVEFATRSGPVRKALEAALDREIAVLEAAIRRADELGELHSERDPSLTAFELHSILMEAHALFQVKRDPALFETARAAIQRLLGNASELKAQVGD